VAAAQYLREAGEIDFRSRELESLRAALDEATDAVIATAAASSVRRTRERTWRTSSRCGSTVTTR